MRPLFAAIVAWAVAVVPATLLCWLISGNDRLTILIAIVALIIVGIVTFILGAPLYYFVRRKRDVGPTVVGVFFLFWAIGFALVFFLAFMYPMMYCIPLALVTAGLTFNRTVAHRTSP
jgi:hypothetical protein